MNTEKINDNAMLVKGATLPSSVAGSVYRLKDYNSVKSSSSLVSKLMTFKKEALLSYAVIIASALLVGGAVLYKVKTTYMDSNPKSPLIDFVFH